MGFRLHRSIKVMPGVRLNLSKSGLGYSVGGPGMRVSHSPNGRVTRTMGIPGTGMSWVTSSSSRGAGRSSGGGKAAASRPGKPGWTASAGEKALYKVIFDQQPPASLAQFPEVGRNDGYRYLAAALEGLSRVEHGPQDRVRHLLAWAFASGEEFANHPFVVKYMQTFVLSLPIATGVVASLPVSRDTVGLAAGEAHQDAGDLAAAIATVEQTYPTSVTALSLADLYSEARRWDEVIALTNGVDNVDDATALLLTLRGEALRETGTPSAARECLREALKSRKRDNAILHRALIERSAAYLAEGKRAMARKDLERILAEDATYPGIREALASIV